MKRLYLLRHAQALSSAHSGSDFERALSEAGINEARALGQVMKDKSYQPDLIYCSPALRTKQTLAGLLEGIEARATESPRNIYESGANALLDVLQRTPDNINAVLLVAHNPSIHQLAATLAADDGGLYEQLLTGYAPATLTVLDCDIEVWSTIRPGANAMVDLLKAADYHQ